MSVRVRSPPSPNGHVTSQHPRPFQLAVRRHAAASSAAVETPTASATRSDPDLLACMQGWARLRRAGSLPEPAVRAAPAVARTGPPRPGL
jgi:hypothetical protein